MSPRVQGEVVVAEEKSVVELYKIHLQCSHKIAIEKSKKTNTQIDKNTELFGYRTLTKSMKRNSQALKGVPCNLRLSFTALRCEVGDPSVLSFALYDPFKACYIR